MPNLEELTEDQIFQLKWSFMRLVESEEHVREVGKRIGESKDFIDSSVANLVEYQGYVAKMLGYETWMLREELGL